MSHHLFAVKHNPTHIKLRPMAPPSNHPVSHRHIVVVAYNMARRATNLGVSQNYASPLCLCLLCMLALCICIYVYTLRFCGITEVASNFQSPTRPVHEGRHRRRRRQRKRRPSTLHQSRNPAVKSSQSIHTHTAAHINTFITKFVLPRRISALLTPRCCLFYLYISAFSVKTMCFSLDIMCVSGFMLQRVSC